MKNKSIKREIVSFSGSCPYQCLHCYTNCYGFKSNGFDSIKDIINYLDSKEFDMVYISGYKENFANPDDGIDLAEQIFNKYNCDILITTRNIFNDDQLKRISKLNKLMKNKHHKLYFCISISAYDSYKKVEPNKIVPSPTKRIAFLKRIYKEHIITILTLRPIFPNEFILTSEVIKIIDKCYGYFDTIIASGYMADNKTLLKLKDFPSNLKYKEYLLNKDLKNNIKIKYFDVSKELKEINEFCYSKNISVFEDSRAAIKFINRKDDKNV